MELLTSLVERCLFEQLKDCPSALKGKEEREKMLLSWLGRMQLNPGMLRTGCRELHQELHIDEMDLIDKEDDHEILLNAMSGNGD